MKQSESRRSFLFGMGAFAAGIFLPKAPRLLFPIQNNPIVTPVVSDWTTTPTAISFRLNVCEVTYVYVVRNTNGEIMARCEGKERARLVARLLKTTEKVVLFK